MSRLAGSLEQRLTDEVTRLRAEAAELPPGEPSRKSWPLRRATCRGATGR